MPPIPIIIQIAAVRDVPNDLKKALFILINPYFKLLSKSASELPTSSAE